MALIYTATGTPYAICPSCGRSHVISRRGTYTDKPIRKFRCKNCGTSWPATQKEIDELADHFKSRRGAAAAKEEQTKQDPPKDKPKPKEQQKEPPKEQPKPKPKDKPKDKPKRSGWNILGL